VFSFAEAAVFTHDLAISAVSYDAVLVAELTDRLAPRLRQAPIWNSDVSVASTHPSALRGTHSRLALLLHQRLWGREETTRLDDSILHERAARDPASIAVVILDDTPLPAWLDAMRRCDLRTAGLDGVTAFVLEAIVGRGAALRRATAKRNGSPATTARWPEPPPPFLAQLRAFSALRRQLDKLYAELRTRLDVEQSHGGDRTVELHALPHRVVARLDDAGVSFSWVPGRVATVADGRLLVIEWQGVEADERGMLALRSATPVREHIYHAEATDSAPESWRWRADDPNGRACSTAHLAADWLTGAAMGSACSPAPGIAP
jgi:hypothetical protein